ncbi:MAG: hypothetical protein ACRC0V_07420 [Fusobacteriaceae bacterium]
MAKPTVNKGVLDRLKKADFKEKEVEKKIEEVIIIEKKEYEIVAVEKEEINFSEKNFNYDLIEDSQMRIDLQDYEQRLHRKKNCYHTELGEILAEANEKYANNKNGVFGAWLEHLGFNRRTAERLICRWKFIVTNCRNINDKEYFESLPLSLTYEVSSPNAPQELVDAVISKKITTRKEFVEMKKEILEKEFPKVEVQINFELIINEMKNFNEKYSNMAINIEKIKGLDSKNKVSKAKLERVYSKVEKLNKELETLIKEIGN